ncbi:hypothetical protein [Liquorilactobacillus oeni]|uniref:hypothetical protein n=1 Tax=Liquorilactobacillus oeni TaxID=303241 RepID=UPI00070B3217|nr:hypothetical protein [Liquorilactobacillus oeni]
MSSAQSVFLAVSILAILCMFSIILGLSWGLSFEAVIVGAVTCFVIACLSTLTALIIGVVKLFK